MKSHNVNLITIIFCIHSFFGFTQTRHKDSVWLTFNGQSVIEPFDSIGSLDSIFPVWENDYFIMAPIKDKYDTSKFNIFEANYPFNKGNTYSYEEGSDYYLSGDVYFISSKSTNEIHGIFASWIVIEKYDSLVNTDEYMCELIRRVSTDALPGLKDLYECKDYWTYEKVDGNITQKVVLQAPEPEDDDPLEPIYFVSYSAFFD